jgi:hypothetical protein
MDENFNIEKNGSGLTGDCVENEEIIIGIQSEKPKKQKKTKPDSDASVQCKVIQPTHKNCTGIEFMGFGVLVKTKNKYGLGDTVEIRYEGIIGAGSFKCKAVENGS